MKNKILLVLITFSIHVNFNTAIAQQNKNQLVIIQTSGHCAECKKTIEKTLVYEKGVKEAHFDAATGKVNISYNPIKTDPDKLRKAITLAGYDADSLQADSKAYDRLKECCKKENKDSNQHK